MGYQLLELPPRLMYRRTMPRANQTYSIIRKLLQGIDILRHVPLRRIDNGGADAQYMVSAEKDFTLSHIYADAGWAMSRCVNHLQVETTDIEDIAIPHKHIARNPVL